MDFGRIRADRLITLAEWNQVIILNSALEQIPDRMRINPFTEEPVVFRGEGKANYIVEGKRVGNASLEDGEILTTGIPWDVCEQIAVSLNARVYEDDRS